MTYTVWLRGLQIGETQFEMGGGNHRQYCGTFHPTEYGIQVLPSITAMMPALFDFGDLCKRRGLDPDDPSMDRERAISTFSESAEGQRVIAAAKQIEQVEVLDSAGRVMRWESLAISDLDWLIEKAESYERLESGEVEEAVRAARDPVRFMISLTLLNSAAAIHEKNAEMH